MNGSRTNYGWTTHSQHVNQLMRRMSVHRSDASLEQPPEFDPYETNGAYGITKRHFMDAKWFEVYDFVGVCRAKFGLAVVKIRIAAGINSILEKELCAFRFIEQADCPQLPTN